MNLNRIIRIAELIGRPEITPEQAAKNKAEGRYPRRPKRAIQGLLPMNKVTLYRRIKAGVIPAPERIGGSVGWRYSTIAALIGEVQR